MKMENPTAVGRGRVPEIDVLGESFDNCEPSVTTFENQSQQLAIRSVLKRFPVSIAHAKVICELHYGGRY